MVQLEEGVMMTTNIVGCPADSVRIGKPVTASFEDVTPEVTLVMFRPVAAA